MNEQQFLRINGRQVTPGPELVGFTFKSTPHSNNVSLFGVNLDTKQLLIRFNGGGIYLYNDVDEKILKHAFTVEKVGTYFSTHVTRNKDIIFKKLESTAFLLVD